MAGRPREAGAEPASGPSAAASGRPGAPDNDESFMEALGSRLDSEQPQRPRIPSPGAVPAPPRAAPVRALPRHGRTISPGMVPPIPPPSRGALPPAPSAPAKKLTLPPAPRPIPPAALAGAPALPPPPPPPRAADLVSTRDDRPAIRPVGDDDDFLGARISEGPTDEDAFGSDLDSDFPIGRDSDLPTSDLPADELLPAGDQVIRPFEDSQFQIVAPQPLAGVEHDPFMLVPDAPEMRGRRRDPLDDETEIDNDNFASEEATSILHEAPAAPILWVEKGKDVGKEFTIAEGETCVGRGIDNDIILTDIAVSRRHLRIEREGDTVTLFDLGSGNGSTVNGSKHARIDLTHGDRIGLGTTILVVRWPEITGRTVDEVEAEPTRLSHSQGVEATPLVPVEGGRPAPPPELVGTPTGTVDPGGTARPRPSTALVEPPRRRTSRAFWVVGGGLAAVLLIGLGAVSAVAIARMISRSDDEIDTKLAAATSSVGARQWNQAEVELRGVLELSPGHARATEYLARVQRERQAEQAVARARASLASGDYGTALASVETVRGDSLYADEARALRGQASARRVEELLLAADGAMARGDRVLARAKVDEALRLDPRHPRALQLGLALAGVSGTAAPSARVAPLPAPRPAPAPAPLALAPAPSPPAPAPPAPTPAPREAAPPAPRSSPEPSRPRVAEREPTPRSTPAERTPPPPARSAPSTPSPGGSGRALALYRSGNFDGAADAARASGDTRLAGRIEQFASHWSRIQRAGGNWGSVARDLEAAYRLDNQISGGTYGGRLRGPLVSYYVGQARTALSSQQYHIACPKVRAVLGLDRNNGPARQMAQQCEQRATSLLARAAGLERSNPASARSLYRQVLLMVPNGTELHQRASQRIRALPQTGPVDEDE